MMSAFAIDKAKVKKEDHKRRYLITLRYVDL